jgi:hypothetical protein
MVHPFSSCGCSVSATGKSAQVDVQASSLWLLQGKFSDPRVPVRPHDQNIGVPISHMRFKHITDAASFGVDFVEHHVDTMSR